ASCGTLERRERLDVVRVGEEVEEVERGEPPAGGDQPIRVARKGYRIAGEITNAFGVARHGVDDFAARPGAGRIEKDEVGLRHAGDPLLDRGVNGLRGRVDFQIAVGDGRAFDGDHAFVEFRERHGEEADAGVEV